MGVDPRSLGRRRTAGFTGAGGAFGSGGVAGFAPVVEPNPVLFEPTPVLFEPNPVLFEPNPVFDPNVEFAPTPFGPLAPGAPAPNVLLVKLGFAFELLPASCPEPGAGGFTFCESIRAPVESA